MSILADSSFDIVYYSFPVPTNPLTVSLLGILFDKVLLPGVYLPSSPDKKLIAERFNFLVKHYDPQDDMSAQREMLGTLQFVHNYYSELSDIFIPTGKSGCMGTLENETQPVVMQLEELIYGPPRPNFTPTPNLGFNQPAGDDQINAPSWISYPANAFVYSKKKNLPLLSDSTFFPFPNNVVALPEQDAKALASYLMAASFSLILPRIRPLKAEEILEIREKMKNDISVFKAAMLSGVNEYINLLGDSPTQEQLERQAKFIAQAYIYPKVEQLRIKFESPKSIVMKKFVDFSLEAPELALNFQKPEDMPWGIIKVLSNVTAKIKEGLEQYREQSKNESISGLSLLLKAPRKYPKE
jgi:hypothetical protein